jgi:hypothetical protein
LIEHKKAQLEFFAIVFIIILSLIAIIAISQGDSKHVDKMGKDQNQILNSYTVAEGARMYIEKSAEYSVKETIENREANGIVCNDYDGFIDDFEIVFEQFIKYNNLPTENMGLNIAFPFYDTNTILLNLDTDVLIISVLDDNIVVTNDNSKFKIETNISVNLPIELSEFC